MSPCSVPGFKMPHGLDSSSHMLMQKEAELTEVSRIINHAIAILPCPGRFRSGPAQWLISLSVVSAQ